MVVWYYYCRFVRIEIEQYSYSGGVALFLGPLVCSAGWWCFDCWPAQRKKTVSRVGVRASILLLAACCYSFSLTTTKKESNRPPASFLQSIVSCGCWEKLRNFTFGHNNYHTTDRHHQPRIYLEKPSRIHTNARSHSVVTC